MSSWNDVTKKVREIRKNFVVRCAISFVAVLASALLQSYVILAFIRPAGLLSSGFTGLAILIDRIAELYGFTVSTSLALVVLSQDAPPAEWGNQPVCRNYQVWRVR